MKIPPKTGPHDELTEDQLDFLMHVVESMIQDDRKYEGGENVVELNDLLRTLQLTYRRLKE